MTLPKNLAAYDWVRDTLDQVVQQGKETTIKFPDGKSAARFRSLAYQYRTMLQKGGPTRYDQLILRLVPNGVQVSGPPSYTLEPGNRPLVVPDLTDDAELEELNKKLGIE